MKVTLKLLCWTLIFFTSCNSSPDNSSVSKTESDSADKLKSSQGNKGNSDDEAMPDLQETINQYNQYLKQGEVLDTTILLGLDTIHINLRHYSVHDSGIVIPDKYVGIYGMKQFVSNTLQSRLTVHKNETRLIDNMITKKSFDSITDNALKEFGVLLFPYIDVCNGQIEIHYSLTIPLTDVGVNVKLILL